MNIGQAIKLVRQQKGVTGKELAKKCNLSANSISSIERGVTFPSQSNMSKISEALNVPLAYLLFFSIQDEDLTQESRVLFNALYNPIKEVLLKEIKL